MDKYFKIVLIKIVVVDSHCIDADKVPQNAFIYHLESFLQNVLWVVA